METKKFLRITLAIILIILIFVAVNKFFYQSLKNTAYFIFSPVQKFFYQTKNTAAGILEAFFKVKNLKTENQELKKEKFILKSRFLELKNIEKENRELRAALDLGMLDELEIGMAEVISVKNDAQYLLINKGKKDGIKEGMPVISKEKVLIGKVGEVLDNFSQVVLISQKDFTFSVEIDSDQEPISGVSKGKGKFRAEIELLPKEIEIKKGALVSTSILGGIFPKGLLVGEVEEIKKSDPEAFQKAEINLYFKELNLYKVFIIKEFGNRSLRSL